MPRELTPEERARIERVLRDDYQLYVKLLLEPDDVSAVVRGHAFIEALLERLLERDLTRKGVVQWFAMDMPRRLQIARAFGHLRDETAAAILSLTEIRNGLAHNPGFTLLERDVEKFRKAMLKAMPEEMAAVADRKPDKEDMFKRLYGAHGRVLRFGIVLLKLNVGAAVDGRPLDAIATIAAIEGRLRQPLPPGPQTFSSDDLPFDENGRRRAR